MMRFPLFDEAWNERFGAERDVERTTAFAPVRLAPSVAQVLASAGIRRPDITVRAAAEADLELAAACVMLMAESGGGRMVWGGDAVSTGGLYVKGGPVTRENYLAYRDAMRAGLVGRQGVGDAQLTSAEFQDRGDECGGCWDPYANQLAGFIGLANRIRAYGTRDGFRRYNGSGPAAEAYADARMAELAVWRRRLAACDTTGDDDVLTADERRKLDDLHSLFFTPRKPWGGGITDISIDSPEDLERAEEYYPHQFWLRGNVEAHQTRLMVQQLVAEGAAESRQQLAAGGPLDEPSTNERATAMAPRTFPAVASSPAYDADTCYVLADLGFAVWRYVNVRLAGINARELRDPGGHEARDRLRQLMPVDTPVTLTALGWDKYGDRVDGQIILPDGRDVAAVLVAEGYAAVWDGTGARPVPPWPIPSIAA